MLRSFLRSKIHRATVTQSELEYEGSLTLDTELMAAAGILPYEEVVISNLNNGERFSTYVIEGKRGSGTVCLNGPTARKGAVGDRIIIFSYVLLAPEEVPGHRPVIVMVDPKNSVRANKTAESAGQVSSDPPVAKGSTGKALTGKSLAAKPGNEKAPAKSAKSPSLKPGKTAGKTVAPAKNPVQAAPAVQSGKSVQAGRKNRKGER
ncbi:MAG: aspartate 1-decarboxylase [Leptospirales bacterium]